MLEYMLVCYLQLLHIWIYNILAPVPSYHNILMYCLLALHNIVHKIMLTYNSQSPLYNKITHLYILLFPMYFVETTSLLESLKQNHIHAQGCQTSSYLSWPTYNEIYILWNKESWHFTQRFILNTSSFHLTI